MLRLNLSVGRTDFSVRASLAVGAGEVLCLLGHSGAGKTTLVRALAGAEPAQGSIEIDGRALGGLAAFQRAIAMVAQRPSPLPTGRVRDQIAFASAHGRITAATETLIDDFDLRALVNRPGRHLSGGESQRLAIVQALASTPAAVVLDEPLSAQDPGRRPQLGRRLRQIARERGLPVVWATHDVQEAQRVADRVAVLVRGGVVLEAPVETMLDAPPSWPVARLLGYEGWAPAGPDAAYALHPDRLRLGRAGADEVALVGRVDEVRPYGGGHLVRISLSPAGDAAVALGGSVPAPAEGDPVSIAAPRPPRLPWCGRGAPAYGDD